MTLSFKALGLKLNLSQRLAEIGYETPTLIQIEAIPPALNHRDIIAIAQTGTGKTAAFALPMLQNLTATGKSPGRAPRGLVLTPTRELALQVHKDFTDYGRGSDLDLLFIYGGVGYQPQIKRLQAGTDIVIATPGRLRDHLSQQNLSLAQLEILVLDEADRMLDMGFIEDVEFIINQSPKSRQTLLFSATFSDEIRKLSQRFLVKPVSLSVTPQVVTAAKVEHVLHPVDADRKLDLLFHLLKELNGKQALVFTRTKVSADRVAAEMTARGLLCMATHSGRPQSYRTRAMTCFREAKVQVLVATDIAARGLDIEDLGVVINYEIPHLAEDYVHRIGRTGRAGNAGLALAIVTQDELYLLGQIEDLIKLKIPQVIVEGFKPLHFDPAGVKPKGTSKTRTRKRKVWGRRRQSG